MKCSSEMSVDALLAAPLLCPFLSGDTTPPNSLKEALMKRLLTCAVILATLTALARAQVTVSDSVEFKLKNVNSGLILGISGASQTAGTDVIQWTDNGTTDHLWHFIPMGSSQYNIENMLTHQLLVVQSASTSNGAQIIQWSDAGTSNGLWTVSTASDGNYLIKNVNSGKYLEVYNANTTTSATIDQWSSTGCTCQEWQLVNTGTSPYPSPNSVSGSGIYVHDPMLLRDTSGVYWLYGTHNTLATSSNRTAFTSDGTGLTPVPSWLTTYHGGTPDIWAPDVVYHDSKYWQYYAVPGPTGTTHTAAIGLATATSANSTSWSDQGIVIQSTDSSAYNAIDPSIVQDASGNWWMSFGSWYDGIHLIELDTSTGKQSSSNTTVYHLAQRANGIEGSYLYHYNGYYYLFASINLCCNGTSSTYHIVVGRSSSITGPYLDRGGIDMLSGGGTILLSAHSNIYGPGGQSVLTDSDGPILNYHYYDGNNSGTPTLGLNTLGWTSDGWPYVE